MMCAGGGLVPSLPSCTPVLSYCVLYEMHLLSLLKNMPLEGRSQLLSRHHSLHLELSELDGSHLDTALGL